MNFPICNISVQEFDTYSKYLSLAFDHENKNTEKIRIINLILYSDNIHTEK